MYEGTIVRINVDRGFGFIESHGLEKNVFFHCRQLSPDLPFDNQLEQRRVRFKLEQGDKGPRATQVTAV